MTANKEYYSTGVRYMRYKAKRVVPVHDLPFVSPDHDHRRKYQVGGV